MKPIIIIHENTEWILPLRQAFEAFNLSAEEWFLDQGTIDLSKPPPDAIFYNRMSASSHTRGHRYAAELTQHTLNWLEASQCSVINGSRAIYLEISKVAQYTALQQFGIKTPKTIVAVGKQSLLDTAQTLNYPLIIKPNRGGKGLGVVLLDSYAQLYERLSDNTMETPLDGTWLLQEYIKPATPRIIRSEFVGGRFLYSVSVSTEDGFELCPADVCDVDNSGGLPATQVQNDKFQITSEFNQHPIITQYELFLAANNIQIAGIEMIQGRDGVLYTYDINTNTNYNATAESKANLPMTGMQAIADYLRSQAQQ